jgi:hypothetical protein
LYLYPDVLRRLLEATRVYRRREMQLATYKAVLWQAAEDIVAVEERSLREFLQAAEGKLDVIQFTTDEAELFNATLPTLESMEERLSTSMPSETDFPQEPGIAPEDLFCRVCGFLNDAPPWGADGRTPFYEHCPCCGVEHGYQDETAEGARRFRQTWINNGARWCDSTLEADNWDLSSQLVHIPSRFR